MNYTDTFISTAPDCPLANAKAPPLRGMRKSLPRIQYELLHGSPYTYTQEDVLWLAHVIHKELPESDRTAQHRQAFFTKGQPCLRSSPLAKKYGWGFHFDTDGRVALVPAGSPEYARFQEEQDLRQLHALRNRRGT
ncbi:MAG: hypothetical protein F4X83_03500 [Chloroflexi bacterium]|nr:hypothetical protein [Chloroflexota bacterium]